MTLLKALRWSLALDYQLIFGVSGLALRQKLEFIAKKYLFFVKDSACGVRCVNSVTVFGGRYHYNELFGLASLQRVYCASHKLKKLLPPQPVVVDVGANMGQFTFFCRHYLNASRIISIEPIRNSYEALLLNSPEPAECFNYAISCVSGPLEFFVCKDSTQLSSFIKDIEHNYDEGALVPSMRLDDLVLDRRLGRIDLLKIDTEGSEYDVLMSGERILDRVGNITVEMSVLRTCIGNLFQTGTLLERNQFQMVSFDVSDNSDPADAETIFAKQ